MHRRLLTSLASTLGAVALIAAPMALLAPSAQAETLTTPDATVPFSAEANQTPFWVTWLEENRDIDGATCVKDGSTTEETWTVPAAPTGTEFVLVVTKAAAGEQANWAFFDPNEGDTVVAVDGKEISHVIWCTVPKTTPSMTGPVVETDRVADSGSASALGLAGAATVLIAGAGAMVVGRRRQGSHR